MSSRRNPDSYAIGQWKLLELSNLYTYSDLGWTVNARMELVGKGVDPLDGENGYASTSWLSQGSVGVKYIQYRKDDGTPSSYQFLLTRLSNSKDSKHWPYSTQRLYFQTEFLDYFPPELKPYLRNVIKYTRTWDETGYNLLIDYPTRECVCMPSVGELFRNYQPNTGWPSTTSYQYSTMGASYDSFFQVTTEEDGTYLVNSENNIASRYNKVIVSNSGLYGIPFRDSISRYDTTTYKTLPRRATMSLKKQSYVDYGTFWPGINNVYSEYNLCGTMIEFCL